MKNDLIAINGPINYMKLKSKDNNKEIHLFFDWHEQLEYQQECEELDSVDINKYLAGVLYGTETTIDFFAEIFKKELDKDYDFDINNIYIMSVRKMFNKIYNEKKKKNIRLHYMDIRNYNNFVEHGLYTLPNLRRKIQMNNTTIGNNLLDLTYIFENVKNDLEKFIELCENILHKKNNKVLEKDKEYYHLLEKMLLRYNNVDIKEKLQIFFEEMCMENIKESIKLIDNIIELIDNEYKKYEKWEKKEEPIIIETNKKNIKYTTEYYYPQMDLNTYNKLMEYMKDLQGVFGEAHCVIMDTFFLRRLLDKNYVKKSIVFTGAHHSRNYVWLLIKFFNYKIDDAFFIRTFKKKDFEKFIINAKHPMVLDKYLRPNELKQCIKIKNIL